MSRRNIIIISAIVVLIIAVVVVIVLTLLNRPSPQPSLININPSEIIVPDNLPQSSAGPSDSDTEATPETNLEAQVKTLATSFAERFGSYSNQSNFTNLNDLYSLMTVRMKTWADNYKTSQSSQLAGQDGYYGVTTVALISKVNSLNESSGRAQVLVTTQRQEDRGGTQNPKVSYQDILIDLVKTPEGWKVDAATWQ